MNSPYNQPSPQRYNPYQGHVTPGSQLQYPLSTSSKLGYPTPPSPFSNYRPRQPPDSASTIVLSDSFNMNGMIPDSLGKDPQEMLRRFQTIDVDGTKKLTAAKLQDFLVNHDYSKFHPTTVALLIKLFGESSQGAWITFREFCSLWRYLVSLKYWFDGFFVDEPKNGYIQLESFKKAHSQSGYRVSDGFWTLLFRNFNPDGSGFMSFDLFVTASIHIQSITSQFTRRDDDRDGYITLPFEDYATGKPQNVFFRTRFES